MEKHLSIRTSARYWFAAIGISLSLACLNHAPRVQAHVPVPESVVNPQTAPEAWNVLRLASANLAQLLREDRLAELPDQASLCSPALRTLARLAAPPERRQEIAARTVRASAAVNSLAQAGVAGDRAGASAALDKLRAALDKLGEGTDQAVLNAEIFFCPMHPDVLSADRTTLCARCGMTLVPRRIPYSFIYVPPPGEPSIRMTARVDAPLAAGREARVTVRLARGDGSPVLLNDLLVAHTQPVHLLIIDPALEDYHHEHPIPTNAPGEYTFAFTPARSTGYRIFADLVPAATGVQEYTATELPGITPTANDATRLDPESTSTATVDGLRFQLAFDAPEASPPRAGQVRTLRVTVSDADGKPVQRLEPVMNAFAHLVGFYNDGRTVVHLHPAGTEIVNPALRGGPSLDFRFYPPKPGFLRLYCQVQVRGKMVYAPFNVNVTP